MYSNLSNCNKIETVSENRYTSPKIDVLWMAILTLLAPTGNNTRASFLVHQVLCTSAGIAESLHMQFSLRVWASEYTCHPIIANLLYYLHNFQKK